MKLTNKERLEKLEQAAILIRDVEFSYEFGTEARQLLYRTVVQVFGALGTLSGYMQNLREADEYEK